MTPLLAPIAGADLLAQLDAHGWVQGDWGADDGRICAHQAIRLCAPVPGDAQLIEQVARCQGWGTGWNDDPATTEADVRRRLGAGIAVADTELAGVFGPQWRAVVSLVRRAAVLTPAESAELCAARNAACWYVAGAAARAAARGAAWAAARAAAWDAARAAARAAAGAAVTWDLATDHDQYTVARRDLLMAPWASVCGLPEGLVT